MTHNMIEMQIINLKTNYASEQALKEPIATT
jgi:hypothetical protein